MKHGPELSFDDDGRPVLITRAAPSYDVQHRERVRKYLTLMFWRIPALILAAEPVFAGLFGYLLQDEHLSAVAWTGAVLIMAAIVLIDVIPRLRPPRPLPEG